MLNKTHIEIKHSLGDEYLGLVQPICIKKTVFNRLNDLSFNKDQWFSFYIRVMFKVSYRHPLHNHLFVIVNQNYPFPKLFITDWSNITHFWETSFKCYR